MEPAVMDDTVYQLGLSLTTPTSELTLEPNASNTIEIIVGTYGKHTYQKAYHLPRALLAKHSTLFATVSPSQSPIYISTTPPHMFQNFLDYAHSNIYSLNQIVTHYSPIHQHTLAHLLGSELGAPEFQAAALRELHALFKPYTLSGICTAARSPICAHDVAFVCENSAPNSSIRRLFLDAVASHWTAFDAANIGSHDYGATDSDSDSDDVDTNGGERKVKWVDVYNKHADFREIVRSSLMFGAGPRHMLLGGVEEYTAGKKRKAEVEMEDGEKRGLKRKLPFRSPAFRRSAGAHEGVRLRRSALGGGEETDSQGSAVLGRE